MRRSAGSSGLAVAAMSRDAGMRFSVKSHLLSPKGLKLMVKKPDKANFSVMLPAQIRRISRMLKRLWGCCIQPRACFLSLLRLGGLQRPQPRQCGSSRQSCRIKQGVISSSWQSYGKAERVSSLEMGRRNRSWRANPVACPMHFGKSALGWASGQLRFVQPGG